MPVIRTLRRVLTGALRALFGTVMGLLLVATLVLNLAMVTLPAVFNAVSGLVWSAVSVISSATAARRATQAVPTAALSADADERARTRARLDEAERNNRRLAGERDRAATRAVRTQAELDTSRSRLAAVQTDLEATRARAAAHYAENRTAQSRLAAVEADNTRLRTSLDTSEARLNTMAAQQRRASAEARAITARMQTRALRMMSRNASSTMVEALPVIGGTAVVATLAWDIYDTCQQLGDLHELQSALAIEDGIQADVESRWCGLSSEDILARLAGSATSAERACAAARVRTQSINPPECSEFPVNLPEFTDPRESAAPAPVQLPTYSYD